MDNIFKEVQQYAKETGVSQEVKDLSVEIAQKLVKSELGTENAFNVEDYEGIIFNDSIKDREEYIIVHEFFRTSHLDFPAQVLAYESQHPDVKYNRGAECEKLGLDPNNKDPILVQLIKQKKRYLA
jgi:hypothetical protein